MHDRLIKDIGRELLFFFFTNDISVGSVGNLESYVSRFLGDVVDL